MAATTSDPIAEVLGKLPSGCSILTAGHEGRSTGMLASWIQQASFEPLLLTVAIKRGRPLVELVEGSGRFIANILGSGPENMFRHFGKGFGPDEPAFEGLASRETEFGTVLEDALGFLECMVQFRVEVGDHRLYVAELVSGDLCVGSDPYVHVRKSGRNY